MAARIRSPYYPYIDLRDAVERIERVYERERTHPTPPEVIAEALGYTSLNGSSRRVISALGKYGLLEDEGSNLKVSERATNIITNPKGHPKRVDALWDAFNDSSAFKLIHDQYGKSLPSDRNIITFLQTQEFKGDAPETVVNLYRNTLSFLQGEEELRIQFEKDAGLKTDEEKEQKRDSENPQDQRRNTDFFGSLFGSSPLPTAPSQRREDRQVEGVQGKANIPEINQPFFIPIAADAHAEGVLKGRVTQESIDSFIHTLRGFKAFFPKAGSTKPADEMAFPRKAVRHGKDHDHEVTVTGIIGEHGGKRYFSVEGSNSGVPEDEVDFTE